ncbi:MAG TPA: hypothetical protein VJV78_33165 [Polyangiales bacterium]|nr:hypothetical protein [Polyangiales bacterium]
MTNGYGTRFAVVAALLCYTASAAAEGYVAYEAGLRVGVGLPLGKESDAAGDLNDFVASQIPLQFEFGVRLFSNLFLGGYAQYAFGFVPYGAGNCDSTLFDLDCSTHGVRLGVEALYHFMPHRTLDPWAGLGFGYEWATAEAEGLRLIGAEAVKVSSTFSGFEFVSFQVGVDVALSDHMRLAPYLSLSLAQYDGSSTASCSRVSQCVVDGSVYHDIADKALHEWFMLGMRIGFGT